MVRDGVKRVSGTVTPCISADGGVTSATMLRSTGYDDYDTAIKSTVGNWRYRPVMLNGVATPACSAVGFIYTTEH
jgi:TonB family protein